MAYEKGKARDGRSLLRVLPDSEPWISLREGWRTPGAGLLEVGWGKHFAFQNLRRMMGISADVVALALGVSTRQVAFWESGERSLPEYAWVWIGREHEAWGHSCCMLADAYATEQRALLSSPLRSLEFASPAAYVAPIVDALVLASVGEASRRGDMPIVLARVQPEEALSRLGLYLPGFNNEWAVGLAARAFTKMPAPAELADARAGVAKASHKAGRYVGIDRRRREGGRASAL